MSLVGGELDQLTSLKSTFDREGGLVQEIVTTLRGDLDNTFWKGPASDRFRQAWAAEYEPMLRRMEQSLVDAAVEVARRRDALLQSQS